ncbi:MAG: XdhC family protein [Armatimonadetes bacterium]|nr:XdhC family protein [Armatimonadota bacterium]
MKRIFLELEEVINEGIRCAFGEVIEAKGSAPQKPGAKAIFHDKGLLSGTLGGGCLEAEATRVAIECLKKRERTLMSVRLDSIYGFDDGLICGGTVRIFLDGKPDEHARLWNTVADFLRLRKKGVLVTAVDAEDPSLVGTRWLFEVESTHHPDEPLARINLKLISSSPEPFPTLTETEIEFVRQAVEKRAPSVISVPLADTKVELFIEPIIPRPHLIIAGAGHIGAALAHLASLLEFEVTVVDDRPSFANQERLPEVDNILVGDIAQTVASQPMDKETYIVIVTRGHRHDSEVLKAVVNRIDEVAYIGMIGSRRKIKLIYDDIIAQGIATNEQLAKVHAPIGIDIGGESVWEIALSVAAELVWVRNGCEGSLRPLVEKMLPLILKETTPTN